MRYTHLRAEDTVREIHKATDIDKAKRIYWDVKNEMLEAYIKDLDKA